MSTEAKFRYKVALATGFHVGNHVADVGEQHQLVESC
jgi:hypothetical protein